MSRHAQNTSCMNPKYFLIRFRLLTIRTTSIGKYGCQLQRALQSCFPVIPSKKAFKQIQDNCNSTTGVSPPPVLNLPWCNIKSTAHSTSPSKPFSTVLLCVIPWFQYERIIVLLHLFAIRALRLFPEKRTKHWSLVTSWQHSSQYPK